MTGSEFFSIKSSKYLIIFSILVLQGYQYEAKRFRDIYATLFKYVLPANINTFKQYNGSFTTSPAAAGILNAETKNFKLKTHPRISVHLIFSEDVTDLTIHFNLSVQRNAHYETYLSLPIDLCDALQAKIDIPVLRYFRNELIQVLKPPHNCPFKRGVLYRIDNFTITNKFLPSYVPNLYWKVDIDWLYNSQHLVTNHVMGRVEWINI